MYAKQTWTDGVSSANADRLGHIEDGVDSAHRRGGSRTFYVAAADESQAVKDAADYVCDGTADQTEINSAIAAAATSNTFGYGTQGGTVVLVGRLFTLSGPILLRTQVELVGAYGAQGTWLQNAAGYAPGATGGLIQVDNQVNTQYAVVRNLAMRGVSSYNGCGIYILGGDPPAYDAHFKFEDLFIILCGADGFFLDGSRSNHLTNIRILECGGHGVNIDSPDTFLTNVDVGICTGDGFRISGANLHFANCKAWFNVANGFNVISGSRDHAFSSCAAQDNNLHGFKIDGPRCNLAACVADSNGYPTGPGSGFFIGATGFNVQGSASDKNEGARGLKQVYGVEFEDSLHIGIVNVMCWQNATAAQGGATPHPNSKINVINQ